MRKGGGVAISVKNDDTLYTSVVVEASEDDVSEPASVIMGDVDARVLSAPEVILLESCGPCAAQ
jgi:hypothetical protein